uniref:Uncharacterized protein n=1 Tax=Glossina pallidipes TaxID=7398 RepID=A0A1B0AAG2_GLOPL
MKFTISRAKNNLIRVLAVETKKTYTYIVELPTDEFVARDYRLLTLQTLHLRMTALNAYRNLAIYLLISIYNHYKISVSKMCFTQIAQSLQKSLKLCKKSKKFGAITDPTVVSKIMNQKYIFVVVCSVFDYQYSIIIRSVHTIYEYS